MALPAGVQVCTATLGPAETHQGNLASLEGTVTPDRLIIHKATGIPLFPFAEGASAAEGGILSYTLPVVDQAGFVDAAGNDITFWSYVFNGAARVGSQSIPITKTFQLKSTDGPTVDLDLVGSGPVIPGVTAPTAQVLSVSGRTGHVTLAQLVADLSATFVPKWKANTAYTAGDYVLNPLGQVVSRKTTGTSGATYDSSLWTVVSSGVDVTTLNKTRAAFSDFVRAGGINTTNPAVAIGDSHTLIGNNGSGAGKLWTRLQVLRNQPGEGLEGVAAAAIIAMGKNGQKGQFYIDNPNQAGGLEEALAYNPSVLIIEFGPNDVRNGGLGLTVPTIRVNGAAMLNQIIAYVKAHPKRPTFIILRIMAPFTTVNNGTDNFVTDGRPISGGQNPDAINPPGLAQIYTDGMRLAHYEVLKTHPDVLIYDPQTRVFGITSPTSNNGTTGDFADQIHQSEQGYQREADDFADWIAAAQPYNGSRAYEARRLTPAAPWSTYHREVEDPNRYVLAAELLVGGTEGQTLNPTTSLTVTWAGTRSTRFSTTQGTLPAGIFAAYDLLEIVGMGVTIQLPTTFTATQQAANVLLQNLPTLGGAPVMSGTKVRLVRQARVASDDAWNAAADDAGQRFRQYLRVAAGSSSSTLRLTKASVAATRDVAPASDLAAVLQAGNKVYVETAAGSPITVVAGQFAANGTSLDITGLSGTDWSTYVGKLVVITGAQSNGLPGPIGQSGPAGGLSSALASGLYSSPTIAAGASTVAPTLETIYFVPFIPQIDGSLDRLAIDVAGTATSGALARLGIYASSTDSKPAALLYGTEQIDTSTTGIKEAVIASPVPVVKGTVYWLAYVAQGAAATIRNLSGIAVSPAVVKANVTSATAGNYSKTTGTSGQPLLASGASPLLATTMPWVQARAA